ncbi:MAG TPA: DUF5801 repeats-in-toxin domain-containing protein [Bradyrhizobium sp.]|nr:DUF5801 repeats-in-toxin domain-containing protein [Bradyrhizobium sp.]
MDQAVAALLPQIIGDIHTAIGRATLIRAGIANEVKVGDPVLAGDVIETAADGHVGIRFVDGTLFMLSSGTQLVLDEFVCGPDGISHSALFAVTKGSFAFKAGHLAKAGSLQIETPVGSIRGRTHAGGFGMLSLAALTFATMSDVQAADPNATFLDDDSITYKDLEHGVFELWTKEPIPRHLVIEDPGQTVVVTRIGSSVSVNSVANSAARMDELQAAQQAVLSNFAKGYGPPGSSTPFLFNPALLQPINYSQPGAPTDQNSLPPLDVAPNRIFDPGLPPPLPPVPPSLGAAPSPIEIDTSVFDTFSDTSGTFTATSPRAGATLVFSISGGTPGNTVLNGVTYTMSQTGLFGTLYLNSASGAYTFVPNNDAINALKTDTTQNFIITVSDGTLSDTETFTIHIHGVEDAAIISGTATGAVIEVRNVIDATPGTLTTTGTLTDTDPDDPPNTFTAVSSPTRSTGGYGTFTMTTAGTWIYTLDKTNSAVQALAVGATLTDSFTVTSIDGTPKVVTITIHGPMIGVTGTAPSLTLSETHLTATAFDGNIAGSAPDATLTTTSGDFSTVFASVQGVDGATISYALSITGGYGTASGLIDSHTGQADVLVLNGNTIEGHVGTTGGTLAFTITVDPATGRVTFTEYRPVTQPSGTNPDGGEGVSLTAGTVNLTATVTDVNGNFQTASFDLGSRLTLTDDGPTIAAAATAPSLTLSETHLTATALDDNIAGSSPNASLTTTSGEFSTAFTSVQGADGATIGYALSITGGNGTASGLIDSHTGLADVLVLNGNTIEGHVGTTGGALAFTITLDPTTGRVSFTEYRPVTQPFGTNPDGGEGASLTSGVVKLTATITDKDGDFQTASIDLGSRLTITDDGPTIGDFSHATILAKEGQIANGTFNVSFGADGEAAMRVAVHNGTVDGYNLATTDLGGGITSVHVTGNGDDYTFYYTTHAVNGGVQLNAFFTNTGGTLSDPFFTLQINPDGTYTVDIEGVGFLQQVTVSGSDFGASSSGQSSLTSPDGLLVITGEFNGAPADVKASNNGIAVGDTGLQMDQQETLVLKFTPQQTDVSFNLTQWQGNGTADVVFKIADGATDVHDFSISIAKPSGDAHIVVEKTSNPALVNTVAFDSSTSTYTLYVGADFNQIGVSYDHAVSGNATFTVNNITYGAGTKIPSTDLLFDVTAADVDGDTSTTSLQVDLLGVTNVASSLISSAAPQLASTTVNGTNDAAVTSGTTTTGSATTQVSSPTPSNKASGTLAMTAAGVWTHTAGNASPSGGAQLTGSNGDDVFVFLTAADSNSTRFDTITDFTSGSDKINLAAFGALAFIHLDPTSTAVPPHTIAWIYDRAANETIVYVNPTDQTLGIGDKALLEVHLQGVASLQEADFIHHAATATAAVDQTIDHALVATTTGDVLVTYSAEVSVEATNSESTSVTDRDWTLPDDERFNFHFTRDNVDSTGPGRPGHSGEVTAYATEDSNGDPAIVLAGAPSNEHQHGHGTSVVDSFFTLDHGAGHTSADGAASGEATGASPGGSAIDHAAFTLVNAIAEARHAEHDATPGNGGGPHESQRDQHSAPGNDSSAAESQHADNGAAADHGGGPDQSQRDLHTASLDNGSNNPHPESNRGGGGPDHPVPAAAHAETAAAPGPVDSFQFKNDIAAARHADNFELTPDVSTEHGAHGAGNGAHAAIPETGPTEFALAEQTAVDHGAGAQHHVQHDLIV